MQLNDTGKTDILPVEKCALILSIKSTILFSQLNHFIKHKNCQLVKGRFSYTKLGL